MNCTKFDLVFGCRANTASIPLHEQLDQVLSSANEIVSTAEATLKEISSLFEPGSAAPALRQRPESIDQDSTSYTYRLPDQRNREIVEECFEYVEVDYGNVKRRWWATENPLRASKSVSKINEQSTEWNWIDDEWVRKLRFRCLPYSFIFAQRVDLHGQAFEGWETSTNLTDFAGTRIFNSGHRYRRRRWYRKRSGALSDRCMDDVSAYCSIHPSIKKRKTREGEVFDSSIAIQMSGGRWSVLPVIPTHGSAYGVLRVQGNRWPLTPAVSAADSMIHELCYSISPLDGEFGFYTRSLVVCSRFLIRNDSKGCSFLVKPNGVDDSFTLFLRPGYVQ
jgi:hypothetical protein